jgi:hypothetical protein
MSAGRTSTENRRLSQRSKEIHELVDLPSEILDANEGVGSAPTGEKPASKTLQVTEESPGKPHITAHPPEDLMDSSLNLYNLIVAEGAHEDPLDEWFFRLGIPCITQRITKDAVPDDDDSDTAGSFATQPPSTKASSIQASTMKSKSKQSTQLQKNLSARYD